MPIEIRMPALSPTMETGNLAKWHKKVGDTVRPGDIIAEIETDKATMDFEAVDAGTVARIVVAQGSADVPVNTVIAVIAGEGEDAGEIAASTAPAPVVAVSPSAPAKPSPPAVAVSSAARPTQSAPSAPPRATVPANGRATPRLFASPLARRLAKAANIDLARVAGSGPHGRVVARDVEMLGGQSAPPMASGASSAQVMALYQGVPYEEVPLDSMRRTIAKRLIEAKQTIPHFYLT
ncbi:MAG: E3 binding domain-containing protein, partial [Proteobacteria bacterium]|nr:E3 binding domain-containing protein [Pseudomonadota bacterium]